MDRQINWQGYTVVQKEIGRIVLNTHLNNYDDFITFAEDISRQLFIEYLVLNEVDPNNFKEQHMYAKVFADTIQDDLNDFILYTKEHLKL